MLAALLAAGAQHLEFINDYKIFFDPRDPQLIAHEAMEDAYTRGDNVSLVLGVDDGDLFQRERLALLAALTEELWRLPRAIRVDSLTNYQHSEASGDDLLVFALYDDPASLSDAEISRRRALALSEPALRGNIIAPDGRTTYINVRLQMPQDDHVAMGQATAEVAARVGELAARIEAEHPDVTAHPMGLVVFDQAFHDETVEDMTTLAPQMFIAIIILLAILMRSAVATLSVLVVAALTIPAALGAAGWLGLSLNQINVGAPIIILTLCICDGVHILISHLTLQRQGAAPLAALHEALGINLQPVLLTSLTTAIGFLCLGFSDSPPFRELGLIVAIGVMLAFVFSLTALPAIAAHARPRGDGESDRIASMLAPLAELVIRKRRMMFVGGLIIATLIIAGAPRNQLTDNTIRYFHPDTPIRQAVNYLQTRLTGMDAIAYSLPAPDGVTDPAYLRQLDAFARWYESQPEVPHVSDFATTIKRLNRNMHGEDKAYERIPDSPELAAQYLLLYELSLPMGLDMNDQVTFDRSASRLIARLENVSSHEILAVEARAQAWLAANAPELQSPGVGVSLMFARIGQNNINSMLLGSVIALVGIGLTLMLALKSARYGALSLVPNAFPALMAFGIWGYLRGEINLAAAAIFSITLGIVVDDTVHFLAKYLRARRTMGRTAEDAVRYAYEQVGTALLVTTTTIGLGFLTLAQSDFAVNSLTGTLVAMTVVIALVYDLLFLPALLLVADRWLMPTADPR